MCVCKNNIQAILLKYILEDHTMLSLFFFSFYKIKFMMVNDIVMNNHNME